MIENLDRPPKISLLIAQKEEFCSSRGTTPGEVLGIISEKGLTQRKHLKVIAINSDKRESGSRSRPPYPCACSKPNAKLLPATIPM